MQDYASSFTGGGPGVGPSSPPNHLPASTTADSAFLSSSASSYVPTSRSVLSYMGGAPAAAALFNPPSPPSAASMWPSAAGQTTAVPPVVEGQEGGQTSPYSRLQSPNNSGNYFSRYV